MIWNWAGSWFSQMKKAFIKALLESRFCSGEGATAKEKSTSVSEPICKHLPPPPPSSLSRSLQTRVFRLAAKTSWRNTGWANRPSLYMLENSKIHKDSAFYPYASVFFLEHSVHEEMCAKKGSSALFWPHPPSMKSVSKYSSQSSMALRSKQRI